LVATGLVLELPEGFRARVHSRSGLSLKHGIEAGAGLIDQGYRHPLGVLLYNHGDADFAIAPGDRIAQLCIERYTEPLFVETDTIETSERSAGWGSSGTR
ncbi:MAG TPA: dUTP diphosphatase, partial [Oscillatoriaceae cyanobacterium]